MKQLYNCGRVINFASLKLMVSTSVTMNSFLTFTCKGKTAINKLFGIPQHCCGKWGRLVDD